MKNILISGVTGFVGKNLKTYLASDYKIYGLSRNSLENFSTYSYDNVSNLLNGSLTFVHLAGKAHDLKKTSKEAEYFEVNYELTKTLFDQFLVSSCETFIYLSSVKAVADSINGSLVEEYQPNPSTAYGRSKLAAESYIIAKVIPLNKRVYILRPCMIHGPGNKGNLNLLYKMISKGLPYPLGSFDNKRSFLSIENLCFVISELLQRDDIPSGVYNVADDEALSTNDLIRLIGKASHKSPILWNMSPKLIRGLAKLGDMLKLPLTTERLDKLTENYEVDNSKIKAALGKELPVRAMDGIIATIKSFQNGIKQ